MGPHHRASATSAPVGSVTSPAVRLEDFDYDLPANAIAQQPVEPRDAARLLVDGARGLDHCIAPCGTCPSSWPPATSSS